MDEIYVQVEEPIIQVQVEIPGAHKFIELEDAPQTYEEGKYLKSAENSLFFSSLHIEDDLAPKLGGNLDMNGKEISSDMLISANHKLYLFTNQTNLGDASVIRLQWTDYDGKPAIGWFDKNGNRQSAIVTHDYLSYPDNRHQHFSIETSDSLGLLRTRLSIPWGSDKVEMSIHDANFSIADGCNLSVGQNSVTKIGGDMYLYGSNALGVGDKDWETEGLEIGAKWEFYRKSTKAVLMIHQDDGTSKAMLHLRRGTKDWQIINEGHFLLNVEGNNVLDIDSNGNFAVGSIPFTLYKFYVNGVLSTNLSSSVVPANNGDMVFELTNDTTLTIKIKGSDGIVRKVSFALT